MPVYRYIDDFTSGDYYTLIRSIDPLGSGAPVSDAWFTVKASTADSDAMALINLHITTASGTPGGYLNAYPDGSAKMTFTVVPPVAERLQPVQTYYYDIAIAAASGERYTVEEGSLFTTRYVRHLLA